jgi:hypothetical protein
MTAEGDREAAFSASIVVFFHLLCHKPGLSPPG